MNSRGMTLIELLAGLAVASLVAAIALASLSMAGNAIARKLAMVRADDSAWLALAAIARDLRQSPVWTGCVRTDSCGKNSHIVSNALIAGEVRWFADNGLWRCERDNDCDRYLDGVVAVSFIADVTTRDEREVQREYFSGDEAKVVEVVLSTKAGHRYERTVGRPARAR